jgi:hypothetical protein
LLPKTERPEREEVTRPGRRMEKGSSGLMLNPLIRMRYEGLPRRRYGVADGCMLPLDNRSWDR